MAYLELFVGPVLNSGKDDYRAYAQKMGALTMKAGALSVTACWGEDTPGGMLKALAPAVKVEPGETIVGRLVKWPSKAARDAGWANMMQTPDSEISSVHMPFDRSRVHYAGFDVLDEA
ncbi:MAG: DUF1428 domain-containing protein [Rhizobiaceae bacterium]